MLEYRYAVMDVEQLVLWLSITYDQNKSFHLKNTCINRKTYVLIGEREILLAV